MKPLTAKQLRILLFIQQRIDAGHGPPTRRDLCERFGFTSRNGAQAHVNALVAKGHLAREPECASGRSPALNLRVVRPVVPVCEVVGGELVANGTYVVLEVV